MKIADVNGYFFSAIKYVFNNMKYNRQYAWSRQSIKN